MASLLFAALLISNGSVLAKFKISKAVVSNSILPERIPGLKSSSLRCKIFPVTVITDSGFNFTKSSKLGNDSRAKRTCITWLLESLKSINISSPWSLTLLTQPANVIC